MLPDGIYLNLPHQTYIDDPALGSGDLKDILTNAVQWFAKRRNPTWVELQESFKTKEQLEKDAAAKRFGTALHAMVLEPERFEADYLIEPDKPDWPGTKEEIGLALTHMGRLPPKMSARADEFIKAARAAGLKIDKDWPEELKGIAAGRECISQRWDVALRMLREVLDRHSKAGQFLRNGRAEVSMFWTDETGLRLKCRFDYLRTRVVSDVKSYALREGMGAVDCFVQAVDRFGYDFSAAHYMDARMNVLPGLVENGFVWDFAQPIFDNGPSPMVCTDDDLAFFDRVAAVKDPTWAWIACATNAYPEVDAIEFPEGLLAFSSAKVQVDEAKRIYREFHERFGEDPNTPWQADRGVVRLTDFNFSNSRARDRGAVKYEVEE